MNHEPHQNSPRNAVATQTRVPLPPLLAGTGASCPGDRFLAPPTDHESEVTSLDFPYPTRWKEDSVFIVSGYQEFESGGCNVSRNEASNEVLGCKGDPWRRMDIQRRLK
jgi:hypothetical protein